ncbi:hypothetical protein ACOKM3_05875 [Streptomyces sp. BH106]|uniref:hypothetical protein n=1 Tax=Streptomyces sp. BH106 TaxID=3410409 RepID=UPI003CEFF795
MRTTKKNLVGLGAAVLMLTGSGLGAAVAQPGGAGDVSARGVHGDSKANASYAYAHATWKWAGPGSTGKVKVYVNDQRCRDDYDSFAFMQFKGADGAVITGESRAWNDNSDCVGRGKTTTFPRFSDGFNVKKARVVVCKNDVWGSGDTCKKGNWHKNPKA